MRTFAGPLALAVLVVSCTRDENDEPPSSLLVETTEEALPPQSAERFPDGRYQIAEITCGGLALLDVEGDGDLDIYLVRHPTPDAPRSAAPNRVFLNRGDGTFTDPAAPTGLEDAGYGSSVAVGDFDQDGLVDVFVGNFGPDSLFRNRGDGTFENRTESAGIAGDGWSTAAAFFDYDADGDLDLWVARYLVDDPTRICRPSATERQDYCGPHRFQSLSDRLFRNRGDGTFEDASKEAGIVAPRASLGVVCLDLTGDGRLDVYVANDQQPNQLWVNIGDGRFRDEARERGVAVSGLGDSEASMGVAACDVDEDGFLDLFITNMADEKYTLYSASSNGQWDDRSASSGVGGPTLRNTGWGCGFVDLDHDGELDIALVNGRIARGPPLPGSEPLGSFWSAYAEPGQVLRGIGNGRFAEVSAQTGTFGSVPRLDRSLAFGDLDGDGDVDLVASDLSGRVRIFRNDAPPKSRGWLKVKAFEGPLEALGAIVAVEADGKVRRRPFLRAYGYAASHEAVAHFGLGRARRYERVEILWPSGGRERFPGGEANRTVVLRRGEGEALAAMPAHEEPGR